MNNSRVNELITSIKSFSKEEYYKNELLDEILALEKEIVNLTFNEEHAETANLRIRDVERHFQKLNEDCGCIADDELMRFKNQGRTLCNMVKAIISGNKGESKAFRKLAYLQKEHIILKNVELKDGDLRTEVDAIVINPAGITIVEVKNTSRDIFIDEDGNYYRTGEFLNWDCNIMEKMILKEELIKRALTKAGISDKEINGIVVFTDNRIKVQNKCSKIKTCFVSQISYIIDDLVGEKIINKVEMEHIEEAIKEAECNETYPFDFDVDQYKKDFAFLMVTLEEAKTKSKEFDNELSRQEKIEELCRRIKEERNQKKLPMHVRYVSSFLVGVVIGLTSASVPGSKRKVGK